MARTPAEHVSTLQQAREARERAEERVRTSEVGDSPQDTAPEAVTDEALEAARDWEQQALAAVLRDVEEAVTAAGITGRYHALWEPAEARWRVVPLPDDDSEEPTRAPGDVKPLKS